MRSTRSRRAAVLVMLVALPVVALVGQSRPASQPAPAAGPMLAVVEFRALTRDGTSVQDLKADEVTLKVAGRQREIVALERVTVGDTGEQSSNPPEVAPQAPFVTNANTTGGREVFIVIDDEGIAPGREQPVKEALGALVGALSPVDQVGWQLATNAATRIAPTTRRQTIRAAIAGLTGRAPRSETSAEAACRTRNDLSVLVGVFEETVASIPSVVVFVSNGLTPPTPVQPLIRSQGPSSPCEIATRDLDDLTNTATASRAHVFGIQVIDDTAGALPTREATVGFDAVAGLSGNAAVRLIGDSAAAMKRIVAETSSYYVAAFDVPSQEQNGATARVEVTVARQGATVRARPTMLMPASQPARAKPADKLKLRDVLSERRAFRGLALRAAAHTSRASSDGKLKLVCVFEPMEGGAPLTEAGIVLFDAKGTARAQWTGQPSSFKQMPAIAPLTAPGAGNYRLRLAARDGSGNVGTIDHDVSIEPPPSGEAWVSPVALYTQEKTGFVPRLQFSSESVAVAIVEIAGVTKNTNVAAVFEIAASESAAAAAVLPANIQSMKDDLRVASMAFPVGKMPPGDIVVRAIVSIDGRPLEARPTRTLRKVGQ